MEKENTIEQIEAILGKLPEIEEGYEWEYMGVTSPHIGDFFFCAGRWVEWDDGEPLSKYPTMRKVAAASPTKITDLVGEDWQKRFWVMGIRGGAASAGVGIKDGELVIKRNLDRDYSTLKELIVEGIRWSHRGDTAYEDANEFVL